MWIDAAVYAAHLGDTVRVCQRRGFYLRGLQVEAYFYIPAMVGTLAVVMYVCMQC
jgi:hypothetical protein